MNVQDYLAFIKYNGALKPNFKNLKDLCWCHKLAIPYSNLSYITGKRNVIDVKVAYIKLIMDKQGGMCHDINGLFVWLLRQLGYNVVVLPCSFIIDSEKRFSKFYGHSLPLVDLEDEGKFFVDPGWQMSYPMKFELMQPHVEKHGIYRIRRMPGKERWYCYERHKKTVYNAKGELLKQGPALKGQVTGCCNDECKKEESSHWKTTHHICEEPSDPTPFQQFFDEHQQNKEVLMRNIAMLRYYEGGYNSIFGRKYAIKKCDDPVTDIILEEKEVNNDEEVRVMACDVFGINLNWEIDIFARKLL